MTNLTPEQQAVIDAAVAWQWEYLHDPDPANCADDNLAALCQRCHNRHDAPMRRKNAAQTRRNRKAMGDLFPTPLSE